MNEKRLNNIGVHTKFPKILFNAHEQKKGNFVDIIQKNIIKNNRSKTNPILGFISRIKKAFLLLFLKFK